MATKKKPQSQTALKAEAQNERLMVRVENIASLFGLSVEQVYRLTKEGIIKSERVPGEQAKLYPFLDTIKAYISHLQNKVGGRGRTIDSLNVEKTRELRAKADIAELKAANMRGEMHVSSDVERLIGAQIIAFKQRVLRIPSAYSIQLANIDDVNEVQALLTSAVENACDELSGYDPASFRERRREAEEGEGEDGDDE